jgi:hypothetical protein
MDKQLGKVPPPIPLSIFACWKPGPANGNDPCARDMIEVGDRFLVLVHCVSGHDPRHDFWDAHVIRATETGWDDANGDSWSAWDWSDVSWYLELNRDSLPQLGG